MEFFLGGDFWCLERFCCVSPFFWWFCQFGVKKEGVLNGFIIWCVVEFKSSGLVSIV